MSDGDMIIDELRKAAEEPQHLARYSEEGRQQMLVRAADTIEQLRDRVCCLTQALIDAQEIDGRPSTQEGIRNAIAGLK